MSRRVAIVAFPEFQSLDVSGPAEVFAQAGYAVEIVAGDGDAVRASNGIQLVPERSLAACRGALDTLVVAGGRGIRAAAADERLISWLRLAARRSRRVTSVCTGAFLLARAGLLDGRRATTHWAACAALARTYPTVSVDPEPIFVRDGNVYTSAGVTAGIDLALALVEEDHGHALALAIARELVMFLRRPGGQGQFSAALAAQAAPSASLRDLVAFIADNLHRPLTVDMLAERAHLSPRQFARVFTRELGVSPGRMVDRMRVETARRRLEEAPDGLAVVAAACGFGTEETMRRAFLRHLGTPPGAYRERFRRPASPANSRNEALHA
jgi:transcriptional regulator GlxA family with amidase domain